MKTLPYSRSAALASILLLLLFSACTAAPAPTPSAAPQGDTLVGVAAQATEAPDSSTLAQRLPSALLPAIVFESNRSGNYDIYTMNADGSNQQPLISGESVDVSPKWSPGGRQIAFTSDRSGGTDIYIVNTDGTGLQVIAPHAAEDV